MLFLLEKGKTTGEVAGKNMEYKGLPGRRTQGSTPTSVDKEDRDHVLRPFPSCIPLRFIAGHVLVSTWGRQRLSMRALGIPVTSMVGTTRYLQQAHRAWRHRPRTSGPGPQRHQLHWRKGFFLMGSTPESLRARLVFHRSIWKDSKEVNKE